MNREYSIFLPNERVKTYRYVTLFILLINSLVFGIVYFNAAIGNIKSISLMATLISVTSLVFFLINFFTGKLHSWRAEIGFIILGICWLITGKYLLGVFMLLFAIFGFYTNKKFRVVFKTDHIRYPSFPARIFVWNELNNVMLKDNILTIDLKNNKLIQAVIEKESADSVDEAEFNRFCRQQLGKGMMNGE